MKAKIQINGNVEITVEGKSTKDLFEQLASIEQTFGVKSQLCGKCQKGGGILITDNTIKPKQYIVRNVEGNTFYEIVCQCGARLSLSSTKQKPDELFPKKKKDYTNPDSEYLPDNGWLKYNRETNKME